MNKIISQTPNGCIFKCASCSKIHLEFKNLNFNFEDDEFRSFVEYFMKLDGPYWEKLNQSTIYQRKIRIPIGLQNFNVLLNSRELCELQALLSKNYLRQKSNNMLSFNELHLQACEN